MSMKSEIRGRMKLSRAAISIIEVAELSARISEQLLALPEYMAAARVMCYASTQTEVDTHALIREMIRSGREIFLPRVASSTEIEAVRLRDAGALRIGAYNIEEPEGDEVISPELLDIIIIPGVAFDRAGGRIGYGAGYFDRFLAGCRGLFVGFAFEFQLVERLPLEGHDATMDIIITEAGAYDCAHYRDNI